MSGNKKKILLVSPFPDEAGLYPHLRAFIDEVRRFYEITYWCVPERGFNWHILAKNLRNPFKRTFFGTIRHILRTLKRCLLLYRERGKNEAVIAIDNFLYVLGDKIFTRDKVILWSHDFITYDRPEMKFFLQPAIAKLAADALGRRKHIIIQDQARLQLLCSSIPLPDPATVSHIFYLPVSLPAIKIKEREKASRPVLMQLGNILRARGSLDLLKCYQTQHASFELYFQGIIADDFIEHLNTVEYPPIVSSVLIPAARLPSIVAKADIGFVFYTGDLNSFQARNASGQLVEFLRQGKPVIAAGRNNLRELMQEYEIGVFVDDLSEVGAAVAHIMERYRHYSGGSLRLFAERYDMARHMKMFPEWLREAGR